MSHCDSAREAEAVQLVREQKGMKSSHTSGQSWYDVRKSELQCMLQGMRYDDDDVDDDDVGGVDDDHANEDDTILY